MRTSFLTIVLVVMATAVCVFAFSHGAHAYATFTTCEGASGGPGPAPGQPWATVGGGQFHCSISGGPNDSQFDSSCIETSAGAGGTCSDVYWGTGQAYLCGGDVTDSIYYTFGACTLITDTTPPSAPTGLKAVVPSYTEIDVSWNTSVDNVAMGYYKVLWGLSTSTITNLAGTIPDTGAPTYTFNHTGLTPSTTYYYKIVACDVANNCTTSPTYISASLAIDSNPPTVPAGLTVNVVATQANLSWSMSTDPENSVFHYEIQRCQGPICTPSMTVFPNISSSTLSISDTGLTPGVIYGYRIRAVDASNNQSAWSGTVYAPIPLAPDTHPPTAPTGVSASAATPRYSISLLWNASTDPVISGETTSGLKNYQVQCQGSCPPSASGVAAGTTFSATGLVANTNYCFIVVAYDNAGNPSPNSNTACATTDGLPTVVTNPAAGITITSATLGGTGNIHSANFTGTGYFEYFATPQGSCSETGTRVPASGGTALSTGSADQPFTRAVSGLLSNTTYYYCAIVITSDGLKAFGGIMQFTTTAVSYTLSVTTNGAGSGTVTGNGINCPGTCSVSIVQGTVVMLTETSSPTSTFGGWGGGGPCFGFGTTCTFAISGNTSVTAMFNISSYTLTTSVGGAGSGTISGSGISCPGTCSASVIDGTTVTLTASQNASSSFAGWSGDGTCTGAIPSCAFVMSGAVLVAATFDFLPPTVTTGSATSVTTSSATLNGSAIPNGSSTTGWFRYSTVNPGTCNNTFGTRAPASGGTALGSGSSAVGFSQVISGLTSSTTYYYCAIAQNGGGIAYGSVQPFLTSTASFILSVSSSGTGTGTIVSSVGGINCPGTCSGTFLNGTPVTLTATPTGGSVFTNWTGVCSGTSPSCTLTITSSTSVTAVFTLPSYALSTQVQGGGSGTVTSAPVGISCPGTCTHSYISGASITLTATPIGGATFAGWTGDCSGNGPCSLALTRDMSVTATFTITLYTLTVTPNGIGTITSSIGGINCPGTCSVQYPSGSSVTLSATAGSGLTFTGWSGDCTLTGLCALTMGRDKNVTATFQDISPPVVSNGRPAGALASGTTTTTLGVNTNEPAYCNYSNTDVAFTSMPGTFSRDATRKIFTATLTGLTNGTSYTYYIRCQDDPAGNTMTFSYLISFSVGAPANQPPVAVVVVAPSSGLAPLAVSANASASNDLDGTITLYHWNWGNASLPDTIGATASTAAQTYSTPGTYIITLTVVDNQGSASQAQQTVAVTSGSASTPPPPAICTANCTTNADCTGFNEVCAPNGICSLNVGFCTVGQPECFGGSTCPQNGVCPAPTITNGSVSSLDGTIVSTVSQPIAFPANTTSVVMSVQTDENATCQYNNQGGLAYGASGQRTFSTSGLTSHSVTLTGLGGSPTRSYSYTYYVRCLEGNGNANIVDYPISFNIGGAALSSSPGPYLCFINQSYVRGSLPWLFDVCIPQCNTDADCASPLRCDAVRHVCTP